MRPYLAVAASVAVLAIASQAASQDRPAADEVAFDHWFVQFHGSTGKKTGWAHTRRVRGTQDGARVWISENETVLDRGPDGDKLARPMRFTQRFVEDEAGKVLGYSTSADVGMPSGAQTREGRLTGAEIAAVEDGKPRKVVYPAGAIGPAAFDRAIASALKPGATGEALRFQPLDPDRGGTVTWKVPEKTELVDLLGRRLWLYKVETTDASGLPDWTYPDGRGGEWAGAVNAGLQTWFRAEEAVAKADADPVSLLTSRIVAAKSPIAIDTRPARLVLRLRRASGPVGDVPDGGAQKVVARGQDGAVDVAIGSAEPPAGTAILPRPYAGKADVKRHLAATALVETAHPRVAEFSKGAVGQLVNSLRCARMIELFVKLNVEPAPANVGFATAAEAISAGQGDWTESATLAVAFARAAGIPARLVGGFVYWPAKDWPEGRYPHGAFAPHTWAELLVAEDFWFPIDPMRMDGTHPKANVDELAGHGGFDATHVAVVRSDLATDRPFVDVLEPVLTFLDGLSIEVVEPSPDGK